MTFCEGRHLDGIVGDECRLYVIAFAFFSENFVDKFSFAHRIVDFDIQLAAYVAQLCFVHAGYVDTRKFFDGIDHRYSFIRSLEVDEVVSDFYLSGAVHVESYFFEHLFGEAHHPVIVFVRDIYFHTSKFGVVRTVHTLVAEVFRELVYSFKTAYDESFQI